MGKLSIVSCLRAQWACLPLQDRRSHGAVQCLRRKGQRPLRRRVETDLRAVSRPLSKFLAVSDLKLKAIADDGVDRSLRIGAPEGGYRVGYYVHNGSCTDC